MWVGDEGDESLLPPFAVAGDMGDFVRWRVRDVDTQRRVADGINGPSNILTFGAG